MSTHSSPNFRNTYENSKSFCKRFSLKYLTITCLVILLLLVTGLAIYLKIRYTAKACVEEFLLAIEQEDYATLKSFISSEGIDITEDTLEPFVLLYQLDAQFQHDIELTLNRDLATVNLDTYNTSRWIQLIPHRKFLVKTYTIQIQPIQLLVSSNLDSVMLTYGNTTQAIQDSTLPLNLSVLPGLYDFQASYYDSFQDKNHTLNETLSICSDQSYHFQFDCSRLILDIPEEYNVVSVYVDDVELTEQFQWVDDKLQYDPIFPEEIVTLTCNNSQRLELNQSFVIPDEYMNSEYTYYFDFNSTSKEFTYCSSLTVTKITINGKPVVSLDDYVNTEEHTIFFANLTDSTVIQTDFLAPWGENFTDLYTVSTDNFDEYYHEIQCHLSENMQEEILSCATKYYFSLFDAFNSNSIETLEHYADVDEMANTFYVILQNIQFDYENYSNDNPNFEESITLEPILVEAEQDALRTYNDIIKLPIRSSVRTTSITMDEETSTPIIETSEDTSTVIFYIIYDTSIKDWLITASYYDYNDIPFLKPIALNIDTTRRSRQ